MAAAPLPVRPQPGSVIDGTLYSLAAGTAQVDTRFGRVRAAHAFNGVPRFRQKALVTYRAGQWYLLQLL
jgi:hypothetical protein